MKKYFIKPGEIFRPANNVYVAIKINDFNKLIELNKNHLKSKCCGSNISIFGDQEAICDYCNKTCGVN